MGTNLGVIHANPNSTWRTPDKIFKPLDEWFNFNVDLCASANDSKCSDYIDDLAATRDIDFAEENCWCNPPYGAELHWIVPKLVTISKHAFTIAALLPASLDLKWYHECVVANEHCTQYTKRGRIKFDPSPSILIAWDKKNPEVPFVSRPSHSNILCVFSDKAISTPTLPGGWKRIGKA